jgi:hypothetical protein
MAPDHESSAWGSKDGREWRIGTEVDVAWIGDATLYGRAITSAIPPVFEAYATLELPGSGHHDPAAWSEDPARHAAGVLDVLGQHTAPQSWWLGYLDTGIGAETVFYDVEKVTLYAGWDYVLIEAGPQQAARWRSDWVWKGVLPDLMFPADRSWLFSTLWDDDWTSIGGPQPLINSFITHPDLRYRTRQIDRSAPDMTPPGHTMR